MSDILGEIMDTEITVMLDEEFDGFQYEELSKEHLEIVKKYIELTRHIQEIHSLFSEFIFNIKCLQRNYVLMNSGNVSRTKICPEDLDDYIAINAYINSIISSGRTLTESIESYIKCNYKDAPEVVKSFLDFYHGVYDGSFSYRLLTRLRDYAQHGHLPVSQFQHNYFFDLIQIATKPHYTHNKLLLQQIEEISAEILKKYNNTPTLSITLTFAEYVAKVLLIYDRFIHTSESMIKDHNKEFHKVVNSNPQNMANSDGTFSDLFIYEISNGFYQAATISKDEPFFIDYYIKESGDIYKEYYDAWKQLVSISFGIRLDDDEHIIMDPLPLND